MRYFRNAGFTIISSTAIQEHATTTRSWSLEVAQFYSLHSPVRARETDDLCVVGNTDVSGRESSGLPVIRQQAEAFDERLGDLSLVAQMSKFGHRITPSRSGSFG